MRKKKTDNQSKTERICDTCTNLYVHPSGCNEWCTAHFWQRDYSETRLSGVDKTCWQYKKLPEEKGASQMNKNKKRNGYLTDFAKRIFYNVFFLAVIALILLALCCDWAEVFYPIGNGF